MQGADLEKIGRTLNRVIKWDRDGMTIEADQRHVREILKNLELEQANPRGRRTWTEPMSERTRKLTEDKGENCNDERVMVTTRTDCG